MDFNEPQSRNEAILQNILGANNVLVDPQSEIEAILQAILKNAPYTEEGRSRIARLLIAIKNNGTWNELPIISRNEEILYCILNGEKYTEEPQSRIEELLIAWSNAGSQGYEKTVSGNPISISDALAEPAVSLKVFLEPKQDLHGYDNPWPAGGGKNKIGFKDVTAIASGTNKTLTITNGLIRLQATGSVSASSLITATAMSEASLVSSLPAGTYTFSVSSFTSSFSSLTVSNIKLVLANDTEIISGNSFTLSEETGISAISCTTSISYVSGYYMQFYAQIESGSTATSYAPYSNICPITGWDEVSVTRSGKNLLDGSLLVNPTTEIKQVQVQLKANTKYTVSTDSSQPTGGVANLFAFLPGDTPSSVSNGVWNLQSRTVATGADGILVIGYRNYSGTQTSISDCNNQIEIGDTATDYEPFKQTDTYSVSFLSQGTVYGGYVDVVTGELVVDRAMAIFDGGNDETWEISFSGKYRAAILIRDAVTGGYNWDLMGNYITSSGRAVLYPDTWKAIINSAGKLVIGIPDDLYEIGAWKLFLGEMPLTVVYELATPLTYQLTAQQIMMLLGSNTVWTDGDNMELTYKGSNPALQLSAMLKKGSNNLKSLKLKK